MSAGVFTQHTFETFHVISCYHCALHFGIPSQLYTRAVTNAAGTIFCPACGQESRWGESDDKKRIRDLETKLKWESDHAARLASERNLAQASLAATKGIVTRLRNRASAGLCPCCNRTFSQLARHMKSKHPDFPGK